MKYCSNCGGRVAHRIPRGDNRPRYVCDNCETIHYHNPKIVTGCLPIWQDRILMCRRAIEPRYGLWTLPAGFMENGETTAQAAVRETAEEACARVDIDDLFAMISLPHIDQVYVMYRARLKDPGFDPGAESLEVRLMKEEEIPWDRLAFPVITETLKLYYSDRATGRFRIHCADMLRLSADSTQFRLRMHGV
jgi:ADP-ribose pyrophosphatase YjhB (NUDIX family)